MSAKITQLKLPFFATEKYLALMWPGRSNIIKAKYKNSEARLLLQKSGRFILNYYHTPRGIPHCGPFFKLPPGLNRRTAESYQRKLTAKLIENLPSSILYDFRFGFPYNDLMPWHKAGFKCFHRITYRLPLRDFSKSYLKGDLRRTVTKAEGFHLQKVDLFQRSHYQTLFSFDSSGDIRKVYNFQKLENIHRILTEEGGGEFMELKNEDNVMVSTCLFLYDNDTVYYQLGGRNPHAEEDTGNSILLYKALLRYREKGFKIFDFEGSMIPGVEQYFRSFGGERKSILDVRKTPFTSLI